MVSLVKGQKVDLTKGNAGLKQIIVGLGWDANKFDDGDFDLDTAAFLLGSDGKVRNSGDFVYYNNLKHSSGAVQHMGDNLTGSGNGDDEQIIIDLTKIPADVEKIAFTVTIYMAEERLQNFGMVSNSYIRMVNKDNDEEMIIPQKQQWFLANCIATTENGNSMLLDRDIPVVYRHFAVVLEFNVGGNK